MLEIIIRRRAQASACLKLIAKSKMVWTRLLAVVCFVCSASVIKPAAALNNGLALTPPMGFNNWERFRCNTDCVNDPDNCISEKLFMSIADAFVLHGFKEAGYEYINIDDCWMAKSRDNATGRLLPDPDRFPSGIPALADYVHGRGLKLGIYEDIGTLTCGGFPGSQGYEELDAKTFAEWKVDLLKLDGCYRDPRSFDQIYPLMGLYLNATKRPILYSCSWPAYQVDMKIPPDYDAIGKYCNIWRNYGDIQDSFDSILDIIQWYGDNQKSLRPASRPGQWNDPDMIIVGDFGLSLDQARSQFAIWAILAAPLFLSADVRKMDPQYAEIVLNRDILAVNQDALGIMGERLENVSKHNQFEIWRRQVLPIAPRALATANATSTSYALVFFNRRTDGTPLPYQTKLSELGLMDAAGYHVKDLYSGADYSIKYPNDEIKLLVDPGGAVVMLKATLQGAATKKLDANSTEAQEIRQEFAAKKSTRPLSSNNYADDAEVDLALTAGWRGGVSTPTSRPQIRGRMIRNDTSVPAFTDARSDDSDRTMILVEVHDVLLMNLPITADLEAAASAQQAACRKEVVLKWCWSAVGFVSGVFAYLIGVLVVRRFRLQRDAAVGKWSRLKDENRYHALSAAASNDCRLGDTTKPIFINTV